MQASEIEWKLGLEVPWLSMRTHNKAMGNQPMNSTSLKKTESLICGSAREDLLAMELHDPLFM